ncbi:MAG TPA: extracellular solute-binding protein [Trueperaceae bacterium]|nr:extracellular solute-binding protein [Trueperaceae bacterium]
MIRLLGPADPALAALKRHLAAQAAPLAELELTDWDAYRPRLDAVLHGTEPSFDAVAVPGHLWLPELVEAGLLAALDEGAVRRGVVPSLAVDCRYLDRDYVLPLFTDGHILVVRQDVASAPADPPDMREVLALAGAAHRPPDVYGIALKAHPSEIFLDWLPYYRTVGGAIAERGGRLGIDEGAALAALELYREMAGYAPPDVAGYGNEEVAGALRSRKVAMAVTWGGQAAAVYAGASAGALTATALQHAWNGTWGLALPAGLPPGRRGTVLGTLRSVLSEALDRVVLDEAGSPVLEGTYRAALANGAGAAGSHPWLAAQRAMLARACPLPASPALGSLLGIMTEALTAGFRGDTPPTRAIAEASLRLSR